MSTQRLRLISTNNKNDVNLSRSTFPSNQKSPKMINPSLSTSSLKINKIFWFNHQKMNESTINRMIRTNHLNRGLWWILVIALIAFIVNICPENGSRNNNKSNNLLGWFSSPILLAEASSSPHYPTFSFCSYIFLNEDRLNRPNRSPNDVGQPPPPPPGYFDVNPTMMTAQNYRSVPPATGQYVATNYPHQSLPPPPPPSPASNHHYPYHGGHTTYASPPTQHTIRHQHVNGGIGVGSSSSSTTHHYHTHPSTESITTIPVHGEPSSPSVFASTVNDRLKSSSTHAYPHTTTHHHHQSTSPSVPSNIAASTLSSYELRRNGTPNLFDVSTPTTTTTDSEWQHSPSSKIHSLHKRQSSDEQSGQTASKSDWESSSQPMVTSDNLSKQSHTSHPPPLPPPPPPPPRPNDHDFDPYEFYYFFHNYQYQFSHSPPTSSHPVYIGMEIIDVDRINDAENLHLFELWNEPRINTSALQAFWDANGDPIPLNEANIADCLWTPSLMFEDSTEREHLLPPTTILLAYQNRVLLRKSRYSLKVQCHMNLQIYPMDKHHCHFKVRTFTDPIHKVNLRWLSDENSPRRDLLNNITNSSVIYRSDFTPSLFDIKVGPEKQSNLTWLNERYALLDVVFIFERRIIHSLLTVYIPSSLVVTLSWLQFWFDVEAVPGRMSLGIMSTLTIMTQILTNYEKAGNHVTAVDIWLFVCLIMVFLALMEYAVAYTISHYYDTDFSYGSPTVPTSAATVLYDNSNKSIKSNTGPNNNNNHEKLQLDGGMIGNLFRNHSYHTKRPNTAPNPRTNVPNSLLKQPRNNNPNNNNNNNATTPIDIDQPSDDPANNNLFKSKSLPGSTNPDSSAGMPPPPNESQSFKNLSFELSPQQSRRSRTAVGSRQSMENLYRDPEDLIQEEDEEADDNVDEVDTNNTAAEELSNQLNWDKMDQIEDARQRVQVALDELDTLLKDNSIANNNNNPNNNNNGSGQPLRPLTGDSQATRTILTLPSILRDSDHPKSGSASRYEPTPGTGGAFLRKKKRKDPNSDINNNSSEQSASPAHSSLSCTPPAKPSSAPLPSSPKPYLAPLSLSPFSRIASQRARLRRQYSSRLPEDSRCGGRSSLNEVDYCSRFVFPIAFVLFVMVYWIVLKVLSTSSEDPSLQKKIG